MSRILVCGAGGFIGSHLVKRLKKDGHYVRGVDLKPPEYSISEADDFKVLDLRKFKNCMEACDYTIGWNKIDEVYQLAADMGGAGFVFTGENDADIMHNSVMINLNMLEACRKFEIKKIFYSSSACVYPEYNQMDPDNPNCAEDLAYPAAPDSEYGWEKLFSERLYKSYARNHGVEVRIARYHNIFGEECTYKGGREKAPAALCRKIVEAKSEIEVWGDGNQTRSFLYIDECIKGTIRLMNSNYNEPVNIGSEEMVTINELVCMIMNIAGKQLGIKHIEGAQGVRGRNSDNDLIKKVLGWSPSAFLNKGIIKTYKWIAKQVEKNE